MAGTVYLPQRGAGRARAEGEGVEFGLFNSACVLPQFAGVINFSVVGDNKAPAGRMHRLVTGRGEIDDRQSSRGQRDPGARIRPGAALVRTAMAQGFGHGVGHASGFLGSPIGARSEKSR